MEATKQQLEPQQPAQQAGCPGAAQPQAEHEWLHQIVGEWECEGEAKMGPDQPVMTWKSREVVRSLGGMWVIGEGTGNMPEGGTAHTMITLGYDPKKERYVGTFAASMMTHLWIYEGRREGTVLTLDTEGPAMTPDAPYAKFQDIVDIKSRDERTLRSVVLGPDGQWHEVMKATYRRTK